MFIICHRFYICLIISHTDTSLNIYAINTYITLTHTITLHHRCSIWCDHWCISRDRSSQGYRHKSRTEGGRSKYFHGDKSCQWKVRVRICDRKQVSAVVSTLYYYQYCWTAFRRRLIVASGEPFHFILYVKWTSSLCLPPNSDPFTLTLTKSPPFPFLFFHHSHRSVSHSMHYKQKGIPGLFWKELFPGQTALYVFNDPLKPHKLLVHAGHSILSQKRLVMNLFVFLTHRGEL